MLVDELLGTSVLGPSECLPLPQGATPAAPAVPPVLNHTAQYPYGMYYGLQPAGYYPYGYYPMGYAPGYNPYYYGQQR